MNRKKAFFLPVLLAALVLIGCTKRTEPDPKFRVVAAVFPAYDWAREILGDCEDVELVYLAGNGVDLHSYQATAEDMVTISDCDLFLYVGGESDEWVEDVLRSVPNPNRVELSMMELLEGRLHQEQIVEGMQVRGAEEEQAYDEHVWLSARNARVICGGIGSALEAMAPEFAESFRQNRAAYDEKLAGLETGFSEAVASAQRDTLLFCDRFPFRYLVEDCGLRYYAAFSGCSGDSDASFATVLFLAEKAEELQLKVLLQLEDSDGQLARTVAGCTPGMALETLTMDSMQSVSLEEARKGTTYLTLMQHNLDVLRQALR